MNRPIVLVVLLACAAMLAGFAWFVRRNLDAFAPGADRLLLLVPDKINLSDPRVTMWVEAGNEEGLHVVPMHDSTYLRPLFGKPRCAGIILPDSIHVEASDLLVSAIQQYIAAGGRLMLVYDAGTKSPEGFYPENQSRFSSLAGVDYAFYHRLGGQMIQIGSVGGTIRMMDELGIPPGKYYPLSDPPGTTSAGDTPEVTIRRYKVGDLEYPSFVTSGIYSGRVLLRSKTGVVAGDHAYQKGSVLFVNIPVGYLDGYEDGLPLHALLKYFATQVLALPYLTPVPDGIGGIVLDWHLDSNAAIKPLQEMSQWTIMQQGPYSIDITAGPDTYKFGDHVGFDVLHNPTSQDLVHQYERQGDEIGSHGGWIHNYFAIHASTDPPSEMAKFLELNQDALEKVGGRPVREYSAPSGNQPQWITRWLEQHHFVGYYFTGDTGMGPTRGYREGQSAGQTIWAFPILHLDRAASFEEFGTEDYSRSTIQQWLEEAAYFTANHRQVRLIYFHPPGILSYGDMVRNWLEKTAQLRAQGVFRWYTMVQVADFLNSRAQVKWKLTERNQLASLEANHPRSLVHETWWLPAKNFGHPEIVSGTANVSRCDGGWLVVAGEGKYLKVDAPVLGQ